MKHVVMIMILCLLVVAVFADATEPVENPKTCTVCGMDRTRFARSRMLVVYADGTSAGLCSLHCAAAVLDRSRDKPVSSIMVADYVATRLLNAREATWVVGGRKQGVMTSLPKWAFAGVEDALKFIHDHGGGMQSFEQAMSSATREVLEQAAEELVVESEILREMK
jgi:nitrous oxide reductase accessory protein NosL